MSIGIKVRCAGLVFLALATAFAAEPQPALEAEVGVPMVRSWVPPVYPREAAAQKLKGRVHVRFIVDETGAVAGRGRWTTRTRFSRTRR